MLHDLLKQARQKLSLNVELEQVKGRDKEVNRIYRSLFEAIMSKRGLTMYISGGTGTGKTTVIRHVIQLLEKHANAGELNHFIPIFINGMKLNQPSDAFSIIWNTIVVYRKSNGYLPLPRVNVKKTDLKTRLTKYFSGVSSRSSKDGPYVIVVLDELDFLMTSSQVEIYEFFNWPQGSYSNLAVIGIANTVNLPEQWNPKITSRVDITERIVFPAYTSKQIAEIIEDRVKDLNVFTKTAIELCAKKVASSSGDIRRGLETCRRAIEIIEESQINQPRKSKYFATVEDTDAKKEIDEKDIFRAIEDIYIDDSYPLNKLPIYERLILIAIIEEQRVTNLNEFKIEKILFRVQTLCNKIGERVPTMQILRANVGCLVSMDLIQLKYTSNDIHPLISLVNIEIGTLKDALRDTIKQIGQ